MTGTFSEANPMSSKDNTTTGIQLVIPSAKSHHNYGLVATGESPTSPCDPGQKIEVTNDDSIYEDIVKYPHGKIHYDIEQ